MADYPTRPSHYAHKLTRLLFRSGAVNEIGASAALLIVYIAHTEDAIRYRGPVKMWNGQISGALGFNSPKQLESARTAAIKGGWLHYRRANNRSVGEYWTMTPKELNLSENGKNAQDDILSESGMNQNAILSENGMESGTNNGTNSGTINGTNNGKTSIPIPCIPIPDPESLSGAAPLKPRRTRRKLAASANGYCQAFEEFWAAYPRREAKKEANRAWIEAGKEVKKRGLSSEDAAAFLLERVTAYASSPRASWPMDKIPHAATWLNQARYDDDPAAWQAEYNAEPAPRPVDPLEGIPFLTEEPKR